MVDYFISSSSGLDSNQGTSSSLPWKTFTNLSGVTWQPGDTLNLYRGDTFDTQLLLPGTMNGSITLPIIIQPYGSGNNPPILTAGFYGAYSAGVSYMIIQGLHAQVAAGTGFYSGKGNFVTFLNCSATGCDKGFLISGTNNVVRNCEAYNNYYGIAIGGDDCLIYENYVHDNNLAENGDGIHVEGISTDSAERILIYKNVIENQINGSSADNIQVAGYSNNVTIIDNTISKGRGITITNSASNVKIIGNKFTSGPSNSKFAIAAALVGGYIEITKNIINFPDTADTGIKIQSAHADGLVIQNNHVYTGSNRALWHVSGDVNYMRLRRNVYSNNGVANLITWNGVDYSPAQFSNYQSASGKDSSSLYIKSLIV